ncbi:TIM barrel protein [Pseudemcibacter aquimaris]|uniref:TIM barrel protein n=1 Tax=Pseudemcibacter aquimaris TaxID=2857064 RepID=UPI00201380A8|nr:TIM barrel protein [Pseudemcibacter aquimaris]MCC3860354.1 TIM barrel protein [Pseudemcibacter aquimaris]WDU57680.1 TIM barrel protein [Pseudemcibacter aquimaris]
MNRRNFLATTAAFGAVSLFGMTPANAAKITNPGIQQYGIRGMVRENMERSFEQLAALGYKEVELYRLLGKSASEVRTILDQTGLVSPSMHVILDQLIGDKLKTEIENAHTLGQQYITLAWLQPNERETLDQYKHHIEQFQKIGEECNKAGLKFAYHNHEFEFIEIDGVVPFEMMMDQLSSDVFASELDLYWLIDAGKDPLDYIAKYPGRFPMCHLKDRRNDGKMMNVGKGDVDFDAILSQASKAGLKHFFAEHDKADDEAVFMAESLTAIKSFEIR